MTESRIVEIRAGEGGEDARLFVAELGQAYQRLAAIKGWICLFDTVPDASAGHQTLTLEISGKGVESIDNEGGGHRVQRVPTTERRGRVHSSTVTVAVIGGGISGGRSPYDRRTSDDIEVVWFSGTGAGGQHRNKHMNAARVTHRPTGIVRSAQTRSRESSLMKAMEALNAELDRLSRAQSLRAENADRQRQVGTGERSNRRRMWAFQRDCVEDFRTGKRIRCVDAMKGGIDRLW